MFSLIYLNFLWIFFSIVGLGAFGLFPSTIALFSTIRKLLNKENYESIKIFPTYWRFFKKDFWKANGYALIFVLVGYFLVFDFQFILLNDGQFTFLIPILFFILLSSILILSFFFPVYVHFDLKYFEYIKQSLLIAITSPLELLGILASTVAMYFFLTFLPGAIPLFSGSLLAYVITLLSFRAFRRIEKRQEKNRSADSISLNDSTKFEEVPSLTKESSIY